MSAWQTWNIYVSWGESGDPLTPLRQTVKARNKDEAEKKAGELLKGRFAGVFKVERFRV